MRRGLDYLESDTKRTLDVGAATILGLGMLPVAAIVGATAAIDTREPNPIFTQSRVGKGGELIQVHKFRTLAKALTEGTPVATHGTFDARASRLAQLFRQSGLDEMPQLFDVLRGTMSMVGLRPLLLRDIERTEAAAPRLFPEWYDLYSRCRPGLVGPSQMYRHQFIAGASDEVYRTSVDLDLHYGEQASVVHDLRLIAQTPIHMLWANTHLIDNRPDTATVAVLPQHEAQPPMDTQGLTA